jgi:undecaprenyl-diphosphatase
LDTCFFGDFLFYYQKNRLETIWNSRVVFIGFNFSFERLRPCSDPSLEGQMREVLSRKSFSFFSGHASNSMATSTFIFLLFRKHFKYAFLLFLFPLIFAYSRIYLGLHFPGDILTGYLFGLFLGTFFYRLYKIIQPKYFPVS